LISIASYRQWRAQEGQPRQWLLDLVASLFTHSQGGGIMGKSLLAGTSVVHGLANADYCHYHAVAYLLTYWSPRDVAYRLTTALPGRAFCTAMDTLDATTTLAALVDMAQTNHPKNKLLPMIVSIVLYKAGSLFRWLDSKGRGRDVKTFLAEPDAGVARAATFCCIYVLLGKTLWGGRHRNKVLTHMSLVVVILEILEDIFGFDLFQLLGRRLLPQLQGSPVANGLAAGSREAAAAS